MKPVTPHRGQTALLVAIVVGAAAVAVLAGILSYRTLIHWATPAYGPFSPLFAAIVDVGMVVFALATLYKVLRRHSKLGVRLATHLLAGLSILYNALAGAGVESIMQHATPPLVLMISVETVIGILHRRQQEVAPDLDRIRPARWLLAPISTAAIRRRMVLWEVPSYRAAMEIDRERIARKIRLKREYNAVWWFAVPRDARIQLKLDMLDMAARNHTPQEPATAPVPGTRTKRRAGAATKSLPVPTLAVAGTGDTTPRTVDAGTAAAAPRRGSAVSDDVLLDALERLQAGLPLADGTAVSNQKDIARRYRVRPARVSALNQQLKAKQEMALATATST